ncbi:MAG: GNAT family N-acetyltransferase [Faecousia sp.]
MIDGFVQPRQIVVDDELTLVKYYPNYRRTLPWYQDLTLCRQVDNIDHPYDMNRLRGMYRYLSSKGECYYLKVRERGRTRLVGDISLYDGKISVAICREYQNRHLGRRAVRALLDRGREIGLPWVDAEIYPFNRQSRKMFLAVGFRQIGEEWYRYDLR